MADDRGESVSDRGDLLPERTSRRRRLLAWSCALVAIVLATGAVTVYLGYRHLDANIHVRDIRGLVGAQPADLHPGAQNIAVIGSDSRTGTNGQYGSPRVYAAGHSDTLMVVHIAASRKWAEVVSIPRDSWVHIPSCHIGNGQRSAPTDFKINEAFTLGSTHGDQASGAACTIRTLEQDTGLRINHFAVINFAGFKDMVDALGGVEVCTRQPVADAKAKLRLSSGRHLLLGGQALAYVRARYSLGDGSDLERITRQQAFMSSLADRARSELYNPIAIYRFLDAATKSVTIDSALGGIRGLYGLASRLRQMSTNKLNFITLPTYPRSLIDPADTANVMWQQPQTAEIFSSLRRDVPWRRYQAARQAAQRAAQQATQQAAPTPGTPSASATSSAGPLNAASPEPSPLAAGSTANQNICT